MPNLNRIPAGKKRRLGLREILFNNVEEERCVIFGGWLYKNFWNPRRKIWEVEVWNPTDYLHMFTPEIQPEMKIEEVKLDGVRVLKKLVDFASQPTP